MKNKLDVNPEVLSVIEERAIQQEDILQVLALAKEGQRLYVHDVTGHLLAYSRLLNVTYWIEHEVAKDSCRIFNAYSHRMKILEGYNMASKAANVETDWRCRTCGLPLAVATVKLAYLDETFAADLPSCPSCQHVFVSEETATVKMALAERMLEDK